MGFNVGSLLKPYAYVRVRVRLRVRVGCILLLIVPRLKWIPLRTYNGCVDRYILTPSVTNTRQENNKKHDIRSFRTSVLKRVLMYLFD